MDTFVPPQIGGGASSAKQPLPPIPPAETIPTNSSAASGAKPPPGFGKPPDDYAREIQESAQKRIASYDRIRSRFSNQKVLIAAAGLLFVVMIVVIAVSAIFTATTNNGESEIDPGSDFEPTAPLKANSPTPSREPTPAYQWKTVTLTGRAVYTYPSVWEATAEIPAQFTLNAADETNSKMFKFPCNGGVYRNPDIPSTLIAVETYRIDQPGERCWSGGVTQAYYKRQVRSFNVAREIEVKKWQPRDIFVDGVLKRGVWKKDLIQTFVIEEPKFGTAIAFTMVFIENADYTTEPLFDQMAASAKLLNPSNLVPTPAWKDLFFKNVTMSIPQEWKAEQFNDGTFDNLVFNPSSAQGNELVAAMVLSSRPKSSIDARRDELVRSLGLTAVEDQNITIASKTATQMQGTVTLGPLAGRTIKIVLFVVGEDVYSFQDNNAVDNHEAMYTQMVSTIR